MDSINEMAFPFTQSYVQHNISDSYKRVNTNTLSLINVQFGCVSVIF
jgi:hypothetical protein